jgi:hypothetical protein
MKKALAGPAKRTSKRPSKKLPERRAMIAAARRRLGAVPKGAAKLTRRADRAVALKLERARPVVTKGLRQARLAGRRALRAMAGRLRPLGVLGLRIFAQGERGLRRGSTATVRWATKVSGLLTPARAIALTILAASICLATSQFVTYRSIEIGQPAYAGLVAAAPPTVGTEPAGQAHSYLLLPLALLAAVVALAALRTERRGLGRIVFLIGAICLAVILLVDLPAGQDAGAFSAHFAGASAVLRGGFYGELAAAAGLLMGGLLYYARPCRIPINLSGRAASGRRRRRRRPDSSRRKAARRPLPRRSGAASARASRP